MVPKIPMRKLCFSVVYISGNCHLHFEQQASRSSRKRFTQTQLRRVSQDPIEDKVPMKVPMVDVVEVLMEEAGIKETSAYAQPPFVPCVFLCVLSWEFKLEDGSERTARRNTFQKFPRKTFVGCFVGRYVAATNASVFRPLRGHFVHDSVYDLHRNVRK
jgi:hypothetical protein